MPRANDDGPFVFITQEEIGEFLADWRSRAAILREEFDERGATLMEKRARELEDWLTSKSSESVSVAEASAATGYSEDHLRRRLSSGDLVNDGKQGRPRLRRGDLRPKQNRRLAPSKANSYDAAADARSLSEIRRGA